MKFALLLVLLLPQSAFALDWQHAFYVGSQGLVIMGHVTDATTSQEAMTSGAGHEANPYLLHFSNPITFGIAKASVGAGGLWFTDRIENKWLAGAVNYAVGGFFLGVAVHNYKVVHR